MEPSRDSPSNPTPRSLERHEVASEAFEILSFPRHWITPPFRLSNRISISVEQDLGIVLQFSLPKGARFNLETDRQVTELSSMELAAIVPIPEKELLAGTRADRLTKRVHRFTSMALEQNPLLEESCNYLHRAVQRILRAVRTGNPGHFGSHLTLEILSTEGQVIARGDPAPPRAMANLNRAYEIAIVEATAQTTDSEERAKILDRHRGSYRRIERMFTAVQYGAETTAVSAAAHISVAGFDKWLRGNLPPSVFGPPRILKQDPFISDLRKESPARAFLMGMLLADRHGAIPSRITVQGKRGMGLAILKQSLTQLMPDISISDIKASARTPGGHPGILIQSVPLSRSLNLHTENGERLPWHLLGSVEERRSFLKGLFLINGSVTSSGIQYSSKLRPSFVVEVASLMSSLDIPPVLCLTESKSSLEIGDYAAQRECLIQHLIIDHEKRMQLEKNVAKAELYSRKSHTLETYRDYLHRREEEPELSASVLARELDVGVDTINRWDRKTSIPRSFARMELVRVAAQTHKVPNAEVAVRLFREEGFDRSAAINLAGMLQPHEIHTILQIGNRLGWDLNRDPLQVLTLRDRYRALIEDLEQTDRNSPPLEKIVSLTEWARDLGITAGNFGALKSKIIARFIDQFSPLAYRVFSRINARQRGIEFDEIRSLISIRLNGILERFDPERGIKFTTFASRGLEGYLYDAVGKFSKTGRRISEIADRLQAIKEPLTAEQVMRMFGCRRDTALAAQSLAVSKTRSLEVASDSSDPISALAGAQSREEDPAAITAQRELVEVIRSEATVSELEIIGAIYYQGLSYEQVAAERGTSPDEIREIFNGFAQRMRQRIDQE